MRLWILLGISLGVAQSQSAGPAILRPSPDSIVDAAPLSIVVRAAAGAKVTLDGRPLTVTSPGPQALTATVTPAPGRHELAVRDETGSITVAFSAGQPNESAQTPAGLKTFRVHPPPALKASCETCHAVKDGKWTFAGASLSANCFGCHQQSSFAGSHTHEPPVLRDCQMCHSTHGSTEAKHLKMPPKASCEQCHPL